MDISIIVPLYNEAESLPHLAEWIDRVMREHGLSYEVLMVDDGSKDDTFKKVKAAFGDNPQVHIYTKPNGGKASALNFGIARTDAEYVVCIDADTKLKANAVSMLMRHFFVDKAGRVGAVAGSVKVGNQVNILTKWPADCMFTVINLHHVKEFNIFQRIKLFLYGPEFFPMKYSL